MNQTMSTREEAGGTPQWSAGELALLASGILMLTVVLYWRTLSANFVVDDWLVLDELNRSGPWQAFLERANPVGSLVYRPLAWLYFAAMVKTFGLNPVPFHVVLFLLHVVNGMLVVWIGSTLTGNRAAGILAGGLFIALVSLHLDSFLWFVGMFDVGAMTCALLSVIFLIRGHMMTSALWMGCALLFKEAAAFLPLLFVGWALLGGGRLRTLLPHGVVTAAYFVAKFLGASPFVINRDNGHAMQPSWSVVLDRLSEYMTWLATSFLPFLESGVSRSVLVLLVVLLVVAWGISRHRAVRRVPPARIALLLIWIVLALTPVLLLRNQSARYYAVHAGVPLAMLMSIMLREITNRAFAKHGMTVAVLAVAGVAVANAWHTESMFSQGMRQLVINDGYFHLVKRGAIVDALQDSLASYPKPLPRGTQIILNGVSLDATGGSAAVRLWYRDSTLRLSAGEARQSVDSGSTGEPDGAPVIVIDFTQAAPQQQR